MNLDDIFGQSDSAPQENRRMRSSGRYAQNQARTGPREDGEDIHVEVDVPQRTAERGGMVQFEYRRNRRTDGMDVQSILELFYLRVPAGTRDGEVLDIEKMGHSGVNGGRSGDLHCTVRLVSEASTSSETSSPPPASDNAEVPSNILSISIAEAVLGGRVSVDTPQGTVMIAIPPGSSSGRKLRIREKGPGNSDWIVTLQIVVPQQLDDESRRLIEAFAERNPMTPR